MLQAQILQPIICALPKSALSSLGFGLCNAASSAYSSISFISSFLGAAVPPGNPNAGPLGKVGAWGGML